LIVVSWGGSYPRVASHAGAREVRPLASTTKSAAMSRSAAPPGGRRARTRTPAGQAEHRDVGRPVQQRRLGRGQVPVQAGEQGLENLIAAPEQHVDVVGLWHASTICWVRRKVVALDHADLREMVGQDARGQQTGHAPADHHGMPARSHSHPGTHTDSSQVCMPIAGRCSRLSPR
jgi:hypothetical protein